MSLRSCIFSVIFLLTSSGGLYGLSLTGWNGIISGINQDAVTIFDTASNTVENTIALPNDSPASIITPDGKTIYAVNTDVATITVIDAATNMIIGTIPTTAGTGSFDIIVSPDGERLYVSNNTSGFVSVIDTLTNAIITDIFVSSGLGPLSITPNGATVYVGDFFTGSITPINTTTFVVGTPIPTGTSPGMISITPDGTTAYVANFGGDSVSIVDILSNTVTGTIIFPAGSGPYGSSIIPDGTLMFVANINNSTVSVVNLGSNTITNTISFPLGSRPFWAASTPDGKTVYVINETTDDVIPIDVLTQTAGVAFSPIMGEIQDIVMSADQAPTAAFVASGGVFGYPTTFNATTSSSPIGTVDVYDWDFGDGNTLSTSNPIVNHTYTTTGNFNVVLTVTNSAGTSTTKVFSSRFMSNNGGPEASTTQSIGIDVLNPPAKLKGKRKEDRFLTQTDYYNLLTWKTPSGFPPTAYQIYRDPSLTILIGTVSGIGKLRFEDHNRKKNKTYIYYVVSLDGSGIVSPAASVTVYP